MPIIELPPLEAGRIAAGEVVERPASVVKELIENGLDAGASHLTIEVRDGGLSLIRVADDGGGIPAGELPLAFHRHATSKIKALADLERLATLGFRGEALASIAAVAEVEMTSRIPQAAAGAFVLLRRGAIVDQGSRGAPVGTSVSVRHLFAETPARLKFLKSPRTEMAQIHQIVGWLALANPGVAFRLVVDGRRSFESAGSGRLADVLVAWHGGALAHRLIAAGSQPEGVWGFVSPPDLSRATRGDIGIFVNGRVVQPRRLAFAVEEAYAGLLPPGRHPVAVLNLQVPPADLDVNVHPTKAEVRFRREREVFHAVLQAVRAAVLPRAGAPALSGGLAPYLRPEAPPAPAPASQPLFTSPPAHSMPAPVEPAAPAPVPTPAEGPRPGRLPILRVLGQMNFTFLVTEGEDGIYMVDQHRAHERVLYERLAGGGAESQLLLDPLALTLTPGQAAFVAGITGELAALGFQLEPFGENTHLVRAAPALLPAGELAAALTAIIDELVTEEAADAAEARVANREERTRRMVACRAAIKAGAALSPAEMRELMTQLERSASPLLCPHGDPIIVHLSRAQLERQFNRR